MSVFKPESVSEHEWGTLVQLGQDLVKKNPTKQELKRTAGWLGNKAELTAEEVLQLRGEILNAADISIENSHEEDKDFYGINEYFQGKGRLDSIEERLEVLEREILSSIGENFQSKGEDGAIEERVDHLEKEVEQIKSFVTRRIDNE